MTGAPRVGLVLGAGGLVGQAYHAGVLAALELDLGWDARSADLIVGSSAGSLTGALLRLGVPPSDLAGWAARAAVSPTSAPLLQGVAAVADGLPPLHPGILLRPWRVPPLPLWARMVRRPAAVRPVAALSTALPGGRVPLLDRASSLAALVEGPWPPGLWVCATRRDNAERSVFGDPGGRPVPLAHAIAASCAIPAYFAPVAVDGVEYLDGGLPSPTNADLLVDQRLNLVVVVSPMSMAPFSVPAGPVAGDTPIRWLVRRRLQAEVRRLRAAGTTVVCFEPGARARRAMGPNPMAKDRADRVAQAAFFEAGAWATSARVRERLQAVDARRAALAA